MNCGVETPREIRVDGDSQSRGAYVSPDVPGVYHSRLSCRQRARTYFCSINDFNKESKHGARARARDEGRGRS